MVSKEVLDQNAEALEFFGSYQKTSDLIERVDIAMGRKPTFKVDTGSTLNFEIHQHGISSTTA